MRMYTGDCGHNGKHGLFVSLLFILSHEMCQASNQRKFENFASIKVLRESLLHQFLTGFRTVRLQFRVSRRFRIYYCTLLNIDDESR